MAADDARAQRIRETWLERKAENPRKFTWGRIAGFVGTTERAAQDWQKTGGIDYDNAKKLAKYLEVDFDWLWRGDPEEKETPDPFAGTGQLDRIEQALAEQAKLLTELEAERLHVRKLLDYQEKLLEDIRRVVAGMPEDETLRLLQEAVRLIPDGTLPSSEGRAGQSADRAAGRRRRAGN